MNENPTSSVTGQIDQLSAAVRILAVTMFICSGLYTAILLFAGKTIFPAGASGSLISADGRIAGSELIAQKFSRPEYFWSRPSAVDYNAASAGGSNLSPASAELRKRAAATLKTYGTTVNNPVPVDLVAASGSGLDPHITAAAARYQAVRVANARHLPAEKVLAVIDDQLSAKTLPGENNQLVNVLKLNLALDHQQY
jgi:K+-transporting ATPase ATPase C chain